eukprot:TRINITY_DN8651_c0_g1_i1.p1 TRINITY_DN8651_c0_g1~~TRINITY_DN8651_c0_g1_i1.p1  ORF type:complete len:144 (-),score=37.44 TRINITY_DN8651_c0_g1_i1:120-551(-)
MCIRDRYMGMVYNCFLQNDVESLSKVCSSDALGYFKALLRVRQEKKMEPKHKYLWNIERAEIVGGHVNEFQLPEFTFKIDTQEIHCYVDQIDHKKIVEGDDGRITMCQYSVRLQLHQSPDLEFAGHPWEVIEVRQIGNLIALI